MPPIIRRQEPERHFPDFEYSHLLDKADYGDWRDELVSPSQQTISLALTLPAGHEGLCRSKGCHRTRRSLAPSRRNL